jgi:hypothetical protein
MASSGPEAPLISVLLPTRGRPELAWRFLDSLATTAGEPDRIEAILYTDEDDPASAAIAHPRLRTITIVGPPASMGAINTACLRRASGDILILANDDLVVQTPRWDTTLRDCHRQYPDGVYLAWPNDHFASYRISTFPVLARRTCELLGDPYPEAYRSAFIDTELFDIFTRLRHLGHDRLQYMKGVVFEHHHHRTGKRQRDATSRRHWRFGDDATFLGRLPIRQRQAERLAAAIQGRVVTGHAEPAGAFTMPGTLTRALSTLAATILGDRGLPVRRRIYLFLHFCGRYVAARLDRRPGVV